jgi:hypothetical protein
MYKIYIPKQNGRIPFEEECSKNSTEEKQTL